MNLTLPIPDDLARKLAAVDDDDLARRALEAFAVEEYRLGRLTEAELGRLLGFETRYALDGFLKRRGLFLDYDATALDRDRRALAGIGL